MKSVLTPTASSYPHETNMGVEHFNDYNFENEVRRAQKPVLVEFCATWDGQSRMQRPVIEEVANDYEGRVKVGNVDVDDSPQIAQQVGIRAFPTLVMFKYGLVMEEQVGFRRKEQISELIDRNYG